MAVLVTTCPHCNSEHMNFRFMSEMKWATADYKWTTYWKCMRCEHSIVVELDASTTSRPSSSPHDLFSHNSGYRVETVYPRPQQAQSPDDTPEDIDIDFKEAVDGLKRQNWTSAGLMFRKALERATAKIGPDSKSFRNKRLSDRIDSLHSQGLITEAMKDWAHAIRLEGNEAAHEIDEPFTEEQASEMQQFTEVFLLYAFTLPERIRRSNDKGRNV